MFAQSAARALRARNVHYGWLIVATLFVYSVCSTAAMSVPGVLLTPISRDLGWSIGELSGPLGVRVALFGLIAPFAGGLLLMYGVRVVVAGSAALMMAGLILTVAMTAKWQLWLGLEVATGVAPGLTALVLSTTIATRWFTARRGLVLGMLSAGNATGQLIFLPAAAWIAQAYGWRMALLPFVFLIGLLAALFVLLARDRPADIGLAPYGEDSVLPEPPRPVGNVFAISVNAFRSASRSLVFWVLAFSFGVCGLSSFGLTPHFVTLCGDYGIGPVTSTGLLAAIGVFDLIGTIGSGWLSDRYDNRWLLVGYYVFRGLALMWLPLQRIRCSACRCSPPSTASISLPASRPRSGSPRRRSGANRPHWCSGGFSPLTRSGRVRWPSPPGCRAMRWRAISLRFSLPACSVWWPRCPLLCCAGAAHRSGFRRPLRPPDVRSPRAGTQGSIRPLRASHLSLYTDPYNVYGRSDMFAVQ